MSFEDDLRKLQHLYSFINKKDDLELSRWFDSTNHLGSITQAQIANVSLRDLRAMRCRLFGPRMVSRNLKKKDTINVPILEAPIDWDNKEWLENTYAIYPMSAIAKATKKSNSTISKLFDRYNIKRRDEHKASKNIYCNKKWIIEHYITQNLSAPKCAEIAGTSTEMFCQWIVRHRIPYKSEHDRIYQEKPKLWLTQLIHELRQYPTVERVIYRAGIIDVFYKHGLRDKFYLNMPKGQSGYEITDNDNSIRHIPKIQQEYEGSLVNNQYSLHIEIPKTTWQYANAIEQRLATHNLVKFYMNHGWVEPKFPKHTLEQELLSLKMVRTDKMVKKNIFTLIPNAYTLPSYYRIVEHFFDVSQMSQLFNDPRELMAAIKLAHHRKTSLNTSLVLKYLLMSRKIPKDQRLRWTHPAIFATIFQKMKLSGKSILDLNPYYGFKAIACAFLGIKYYTLPNPIFDVGLKHQFADFLQLDHQYYRGQEVDLVMADSNFKATADFESAFKYANQAKNMLLYVAGKDHDVYYEKYKPQSVIPLRIKIFDTESEHLFVF